jgi:hypothetical protein
MVFLGVKERVWVVAAKWDDWFEEGWLNDEKLEVLVYVLIDGLIDELVDNYRKISPTTDQFLAIYIPSSLEVSCLRYGVPLLGGPVGWTPTWT